MIKHIICDLGNVILMHDFRRTTEALAKHCSATSDEIFEDISHSSLYRIFTKGLISTEDFYSELSYDLCSLMSYDEFVMAWGEGLMEVNQEFYMDVIKKLYARGFKLHLLSNLDEIHWGKAQKICVEPLKYFDSIFLSFKTHLKKPNPAIYIKVLKEINARPEECLFIDDREENIEFASVVGLKVLLYNRDRHSFFVRKLNRLLNLA